MKKTTIALIVSLTLSTNAFAVWDTMITNDLPRPSVPSGQLASMPTFTYYSVANGGILNAQGTLINGQSASPSSNAKTQPANHLVGYSSYTVGQKGTRTYTYKCIYNTPTSTPIGDTIRTSQLQQISCTKS